jgi:putative ABC transport system substrate-binding protein
MGTANDADAQVRSVALQERLRALGWSNGRNIQIEYRFAAGDAQRMGAYAKEMVSAAPDLIIAQTNL